MQLQQISKKKYTQVPKEIRSQLIYDVVKNHSSLSEVSRKYALKLSTCKSIMKIYKNEGRWEKKKTRKNKTKIDFTFNFKIIGFQSLKTSINTQMEVYFEKNNFSSILNNPAYENMKNEEIVKQFTMIVDNLKKVILENKNVLLTEEGLTNLENSFKKSLNEVMNKLTQNKNEENKQIQQSQQSTSDSEVQNRGHQQPTYNIQNQIQQQQYYIQNPVSLYSQLSAYLQYQIQLAYANQMYQRQQPFYLGGFY